MPRDAQVADDAFLNQQKCFHPVRIDYFLQIAILARLDEQISVQEGTLQRFRQQHADGAFAGTGHADEYDILHGGIMA